MVNPENYLIAISWFPRLLGVIYFFAFGAFIYQIRGLIGKKGILPVKRFLEFIQNRVGAKRFYYFPSLFWINASDFALMAIVIAGTLLSILLVFGYYPWIILPILWVMHLSIVSVGQDFLGFGWEGFFLEIAFNAIFLTWSSSPNILIWVSLNILIFRFHIQAGAVKLQSGDPSWKNLTALAYHYETQPLPNTQAWFFHRLPLWFHKLSSLLMFFVELAIPFLIFGTESMRLVAFFAFFGLQFFIWFSGNYSYLNHLTVVLCTLLISDAYLPFNPPLMEATPVVWDSVLSLIGAGLIFLQILRFWHSFFPSHFCSRVLDKVSPFHLANRYGIFAIMTTSRYEIVFEGSADGTTWKPYHFWYKPSEPYRRPRRIAPYQPRLDWQAWFLPFTYYENEAWVQNFMQRLLEGSRPVLKLIRHNPFPDTPPKYLRAQMYVYKFAKNDWWERDFLGHYSPALSLPSQE